MPLPKPLNVQQSRFAAIALDSDSESDSGNEGEWKQVPKAASKGSLKAGEQHADESKPLSKNAKKRARKRRNRCSASSEHSNDGREEVRSGEPREGSQAELRPAQRSEHDTAGAAAAKPVDWKRKHIEALDTEFQQNLEQAILVSTLEAEQNVEIEKQKQAAKELVSKMAKSKKESKKGVTLSLQELHRGAVQNPSPSSPKTVNGAGMKETAPSSQFFERVEGEVLSLNKKERKQERTVSQSESPTSEDMPRIAQLMDELEKRDKLIAEFKKDREALKKTLKEVKERNQSLCKILGQGEFSTKAQLIEQIDQLSSVKNELTEEVEKLYAQLEQEKSKNKSMKLEIAKMQGLNSKGAASNKSNH